MAGYATQDEKVGQDVDHVDRLELAIDVDRQALMGELIDDVEHAVLVRFAPKAIELLRRNEMSRCAIGDIQCHPGNGG